MRRIHVGILVPVVCQIACHPGSSSLRDPTGGTELFLGYRAPPGGLALTTTELGEAGGLAASALDQGYRQQADRAPPPVSLTPTDGSELALRDIAADVQIRGPLAHTELHFT